MSEKANIEHDGIGESGGKLINDIQECLNSIREKLVISIGSDARTLYEEMTSEQTKKMVDKKISSGVDIS